MRKPPDLSRVVPLPLPLLIHRIACDPIARRELLWLEAMRRGKPEHARDLERADPKLVQRLTAAYGHIDDTADFEALERECMERHASRYGIRSSPASHAEEETP